MRDITSLEPQEAARVFETLIGGLEVPGATGASAAPNVSDKKKRLASAYVSLVRNCVTEGEREMWPHYKRWSLNIEYMLDNPFAAWNPRYKVVDRTPAADQNDRAGASHLHPVSYNLFKAACYSIIARFAATRPQVIIKPGSTQEEVVEASRPAQRIVGEYEFERQGMEEVLAELVPNMVLTANGILKVTWNSKGGKYLGAKEVPVLDQNGDPIPEMTFDYTTGEWVQALDEDGEPRWKAKKDKKGNAVEVDEWEGAIETCVVQGRDFIVDPTATRFKDANWCIHRYKMSPAAVFKKWEKEVTADGQATDGDSYAFNRRRQESTNGYCTIYELWIKPGNYKYGPNPNDVISFKKGYLIVCTGSTILDYGENPYEHGELPFVFIPCMRVPGELWGDTIANALRMLQNSFNKTGSQIVQANDLMGNPQWLLPNSVKMPAQDRINKAGIFKRYEAGLNGEKPEIVPGTGVSPSVWRYWDSLRSLFMQISGVQEGGLGGGAPASIESGKALNALVERDVSRLAPMGMEIGRGLKRWAWLTLKLIQQYWTTRRTVNIVGQYQVAEAISFGGVDVYDSFDINVAPESTMPQTAAMRQAKADALFDRGLLKPYDYIRRVGEDTAEEFTSDTLDVANARLENAMARRQGYVPIMEHPEQMEIEDHTLHMEEHRRELLNPTLRKMPERWLVLKQHFDLHEEMAAGQAQETLEGQAALTQAQNPQQGGGQAQNGPGSNTPAAPPAGPLPLG